MKDDLISRSALLEALKTEEWAAILGNSFVRYMKAKTLIEKIPAVDAETVIKSLPYVKEALEMAKQSLAPVVRCKDCELWDPDPDTYGDSIGPKGKCMKSFETTICDDFCSYGERKADDATD